jgi:hypothetical protein
MMQIYGKYVRKNINTLKNKRIWWKINRSIYFEGKKAQILDKHKIGYDPPLTFASH